MSVVFVDPKLILSHGESFDILVVTYHRFFYSMGYARRTDDALYIALEARRILLQLFFHMFSDHSLIFLDARVF